MTRARALSTLVAVLVLASILSAAWAVGPASAKSNETVNNSTAAPAWEPPGEYNRSFLREGGSPVPGYGPSSRAIQIDDAPLLVYIKYMPVKPGADEAVLSPQQTIHSRKLGLVSSQFGDTITANLTLHIVVWENKQLQVPAGEGTVNRTFAVNQTERTITYSVGPWKDRKNVTIPGVYDQTKRLSMWLTYKGEVLTHFGPYDIRTNPGSKPVQIANQWEYWRYTIVNWGWMAIAGVLLGPLSAWKYLQRAVVGPMFGLGAWIGIFIGLAVIAVFGLFFQTSVIIARAPWLIGLWFYLGTFLGYIVIRNREVETAKLEQRDLTTTTTPGDGVNKQERSRTVKLLRILIREGKLYAPAKGFRPAIARFFTTPGWVPSKDLNIDACEGDVDRHIEVDPEADSILHRRPATLRFNPTIIRPQTTDDIHAYATHLRSFEDVHPFVATVAAAPLSLLYLLKRVNWRYLASIGIGAGLGVAAGRALFGFETIGWVAAAVPALVFGMESVGGELSVEPAPYHDRGVDAVLATERVEHKEAKTFEELEEAIAELDLGVIEQRQDIVDQIRTQFGEKYNEIMGHDDNGAEPGGGRPQEVSQND